MNDKETIIIPSYKLVRESNGKMKVFCRIGFNGNWDNVFESTSSTEAKSFVTSEIRQVLGLRLEM